MSTLGKPAPALIGSLLFCITILPGLGCHGDAVAFYRMHGQIIDASTQEPVANAKVWARPDPEGPIDRQRTPATATGADGSFGIDFGQGIGSVTWVLFVPIFQGPMRLLPVDEVYVEVEHDGKAGKTLVHPAADRQKPKRGGSRRIDLGAIPVTLGEVSKQ